MQQSYKFDKTTIIKILKGGLISATGAGSLYILNALGAVHFTNPYLTSFLAWFIPFSTNFIHEWMKGK